MLAAGTSREHGQRPGRQRQDCLQVTAEDECEDAERAPATKPDPIREGPINGSLEIADERVNQPLVVDEALIEAQPGH